MNNITKAVFNNTRSIVTPFLWQYDYGQILQIEGIELPASYEVHFSNQEEAGTAKTSIGSSEGVVIPDEYLQTGKPIWAYIYLHEGEDDGETEYKVQIPVKARPQATNEEPTPVQQDVITQAIAALNAAVEQTTADVEHYPRVIDGYWYVYDAETETFVNTGAQATGDK